MIQHVSARLLGEVAPDNDALQQGIVDDLTEGTCVFACVARDLDPRTRRVLTYLSDGAGLAMFAVEVDNFRTENRSEAVLVPRVAFVPSALIEQRGKSIPC